jgi:hypothetical protein
MRGGSDGGVIVRVRQQLKRLGVFVCPLVVAATLRVVHTAGHMPEV